MCRRRAVEARTNKLREPQKTKARGSIPGASGATLIANGDQCLREGDTRTVLGPYEGCANAFLDDSTRQGLERCHLALRVSLAGPAFASTGNSMHALSRRAFLKSVAVTTGATLGATLPGARLLGEARADGPPEKAAVVVIHLVGGYNAFFSSADSFLNRAFLVNDGNVMPIGNGLVVDRASLGALPDFARTHMATIGNRHGTSDHDEARRRV